MNHFLNYAVVVLLCTLSGLYFSSSLNVQFHFLAFRYGPYSSIINQFITGFLLTMGGLLLLGAIVSALLQARYDRQSLPWIPRYILGTQLFAFGLVGLEHVYIYTFLETPWTKLLLVLGIVLSILGFLNNKNRVPKPSLIGEFV